jgi:hypothetical protein
MGARSRPTALLVLTLVVFPLLAIPLYLLVLEARPHRLARFAVTVGVAGPGLLALVIASFRLKFLRALALGFASSMISLGVLFAAFLIYCDAINCD